MTDQDHDAQAGERPQVPVTPSPPGHGGLPLALLPNRVCSARGPCGWRSGKRIIYALAQVGRGHPPHEPVRARRTPDEQTVDQAVSEALPDLQDRGATRERRRSAQRWDVVLFAVACGRL
jgi:hypothetical protein